MKRGMLFKIGVTFIIAVGIIIFFLINLEVNENGLPSRQLVLDGTIKMKLLLAEENLEEEPPWMKVSDHEFGSHSDGLFSDEAIENVDQEFYYDNNIPYPDTQTKKKVFNKGDQRPVISRRSGSNHQPLVHLCVVVCENRAREALTMLKSAAIVTMNASLVFHIVADKERQTIVQDELNSWPDELHQHITYHIYDVAYPRGNEHLKIWNNLYKPCASQRLFLPDRLTLLDSVIYVDTDTIFLHSVGALWSHFSHFNSTQLVGLVRESEDGTAGWYNRFANHPFYGEFGLNSGVMLMNLTRIRQTKWLSILQADYEKYRLAITWGDQDLINIYFSKQPEQVYLISCEWNYRADHCMYTSNCKSAERNGVSLLHASRGAFYSNKEPVFGAIHYTFQQVSLGSHQTASLLSDLKRELKNTAQLSSCGEVNSLFLTRIEGLVSSNLSGPVILLHNSQKLNDGNLNDDIYPGKASVKRSGSIVYKGTLNSHDHRNNANAVGGSDNSLSFISNRNVGNARDRKRVHRVGLQNISRKEKSVMNNILQINHADKVEMKENYNDSLESKHIPGVGMQPDYIRNAIDYDEDDDERLSTNR